MNGKKAKMIRRLALQMTPGKPMVKYHDKALNPEKPTRRTRFLYDCTRVLIKNLKQRFKDGDV